MPPAVAIAETNCRRDVLSPCLIAGGMAGAGTGWRSSNRAQNPVAKGVEVVARRDHVVPRHEPLGGSSRAAAPALVSDKRAIALARRSRVIVPYPGRPAAARCTECVGTWMPPGKSSSSSGRWQDFSSSSTQPPVPRASARNPSFSRPAASAKKSPARPRAATRVVRHLYAAKDERASGPGEKQAAARVDLVV